MIERYDAGDNGIIDYAEVIQAIKDYFYDLITRADLLVVVKAYFADLPWM